MQRWQGDCSWVAWGVTVTWNEGARGGVEVLLVEDNPGDVRLMQEAFKEGTVAVHLNIVRDGVQAVDYLHQTGDYVSARRPDLILLDLNLPRKNGREVLAEIKNDPDLRQIPVIVMTTSTLEQDVQKAYELKANCYITKPIELDDLLGIVTSLKDFWFTKATLPTL